ncbi:hypothetical protein B0813_002945 [Candidatus Fervidibacteria bacterium JGI MDM2 SSWTFF-3-K9]
MREIEAKQSKKPISKRDNRAVTLLSLSASPTAPAQPRPEAGVAFVGRIYIDAKRRSSVVVIQHTPTTYQIHRSPYGTSMRLHQRFVRLVSTFRLPKRFKRIFNLLVKPIKPSRFKLVKPKLLPKVATTLQKRVRAPTKRKRKANDEDAEGDADSHDDFWFATVKPRAQRAPHFRAARRRGEVVGSLSGCPQSRDNPARSRHYRTALWR